jgi:hypothetical protein
MSDDNPVAEQNNNCRTIYQELCNSYRAIDDFRAKLLGFLPLATGTGIVVLLTSSNFSNVLKLGAEPDGQTLTPEIPPFLGEALWAAGAFGFLITLGLFCYELYGVKKCHALIKAGKKLEKSLGIDGQGGQFTKRPREVAKVINEPFAAGVIYPAVLAAWTFLALVFTSPDARWWAIGVFIGGFLVSFLFNLWLKLEDKIREWEKVDEEKEVTIYMAIRLAIRRFVIAYEETKAHSKSLEEEAEHR